MERKKITLTILTIIFMLIVVISATYAFFATNITVINNVTLNAEVPDVRSTFTAYSTDSLQLNVGLANVLMASTNASVTDTGTLIVKLASPSAGQQMQCTYDIQYIWDGTNQYSTPTMTLTAGFPYELSLAATVSASGDSFSSYNYASKNLVEKDLSQFSWTGTAGTAGRKTTVISGAKIYANTTAGTTATWTFNMNFYTLPSDQSSFSGKDLLAHIAVGNVQC